MDLATPPYRPERGTAAKSVVGQSAPAFTAEFVETADLLRAEAELLDRLMGPLIAELFADYI